MADPDGRSWHEPLSERENQILSLIADGHSNREIARELSLSLDTIKWYNKQLFGKLGVSSRTQAASTARQYGLLGGQSLSQAGTDSTPQHNLPHIPTSFIGRKKELAEIKRLLQDSPLVVLTGVGGSGKTRLALQVASGLVDYYPHGVWLVELAPLSDPGLVPNTILDALSVSKQGEISLMEIIKQFLQHRQLLLILDNFEHLLEAAPLVGDLVASAPKITVLATSRERLHVYGEVEYPIQPLPVPDLAEGISPEQLAQCESVSLFLERAKAVKHDFILRQGEAAALARVCVHLDGLPLALELAASQVKLFSLAALDERLNDRLRLLTDGARDLPERQRSLRNAIDWSYELLETGERSLFARMAVFRGGGTLEAVERICGQGLQADLVALLSSLVDKSLVRTRESRDGELRFDMLETIREYAVERLEFTGEIDNLSREHAEYYASLSETAAGELRSRKQRYWFARLHSEYDNLRSALTWSLNSAAIEYGLRITAALRDYWYYTGNLHEYQYWTDLALERMAGASKTLQAGVLMCASLLYAVRREKRRGQDLAQQAIEMYSQLGDEGKLAWAKLFLSALHFDQPTRYEEAVSLCRVSLETFQRIGDLPGQSQALNILGEYSRLKGELEESRRYYEQCLELVARTGEKLREGMLNENLGFIAYRQGEYRQALRLMRNFIRIGEELGNDYGLLTGIASLSGPLAALGQPERAAQLLAAAETHIQASGSDHQTSDLPEFVDYSNSIRNQLGDAAFQAAWEKGSRLTMQQVLALALEDMD